jgi:tetrahydromethanopterin S-methyltransferase subunit G
MGRKADNAGATREELRLAIGVAVGALSGAVIGAAFTGYMQLLEETAGLRDPDMTWVILGAFIGGLGGALAGAVVGLITGLVLVARGNSVRTVRLR